MSSSDARIVAAALGVVLLGTGVAEAALTTAKCLVKKRQAWITFRKCQGAEDVKRLKAKPVDLAKCQSKLDEQLAKIDAQAAKAAVACRFGNNGDGTVTDYDTGLMWERKTGVPGGLCFLIPIGSTDHCVNVTLNWLDAQAYVGGASADGATVSAFLAGHTDWRLPTIAELRTILDLAVPGCGPLLACIDPIFGPTRATSHWSSSTYPSPDFAAILSFSSGNDSGGHKINLTAPVRAVRGGL